MFKINLKPDGAKVLISVILLMAGLGAALTARHLPQLKIAGQMNNLNKYEGYYGTIYYEGSNNAHAETIMRIVDGVYPYLKNDFGIEESLRPSIIIHNDKESLYKALGKDYGDNPPMGAYYAGVINILSPEEWVNDENAGLTDKFIKYGPVIHELTHFMLDAKAKGNYELWFCEGVALYSEYKYTGVLWEAENPVSADEIDFCQMQAFFSSAEEDAAYRAAFDKVRAIVNIYGEAGLKEIMESLANKENFLQVMEEYAY
ncbi:hypothetical protein LJB89_02540 [Tyzzerella sp. OttesenSCG-928-J15]|nr:hypothetical protein [Tyzzerella sp. OttesenSCG-928-J15]